MAVFISWIILSFVVAWIGADRRIGCWMGFVISILLSPLVGFIFVLISKSKSEIEKEEKILNVQLEQKELLEKLNDKKDISTQLNELVSLRDNGILTEEEYTKAKSKLLE